MEIDSPRPEEPVSKRFRPCHPPPTLLTGTTRKREFEEEPETFGMQITEEDAASRGVEEDALLFKKLRIQTFSPRHLVAQRRLRADIRRVAAEDAPWRTHPAGVQVSMEPKGEDPFSAYLWLAVANREMMVLVTAPETYPFMAPSVTLARAVAPELAGHPAFGADGCLQLPILESWNCTSGVEDVVNQCIQLLQP
eukprot:TRINITY_DN5318_c0_g1_i3.p1 TRINITY_DN5318_c0_g1~~TRINITY_DN5318_c0_g1_i3.p1  ORF type:complete len:195 (-),score=26.47 TRINITY_DN5318_c0_g1_i3:266-850(-)